jgi:hypothetical protein
MLCPGFLDADDIRVHRRQPLEKTLARRGTNAVHVDADNSEQFNAPISLWILRRATMLPAHDWRAVLFPDRMVTLR